VGRIVAVSVTAGVAGWAASQALLGGDPGRVATLGGVFAIAVGGAAIVLAGYRLLGVPGALSARTGAAAPAVAVEEGELRELPPEVLA
jgi:hypothetical protein